MRRMSLLVVLAVWLVAHPAIAQNTTRQVRSSPMMRKAERVEVAAPEAVQKSLAAVDTLRNFDFGQAAVTWFWNVAAPDSGFVFGTNLFEDRAKATALILPDGVTTAQVQEVIIWFSYKRDGLTTQTYAIEILEGTPNSGPTNLLDRDVYQLADVNADEDLSAIEPTHHMLSQPVNVDSSFFVSVDFGSYGEADWGDAAIVATDVLGRRIPEVWEKWADSTWHNASDFWWGTQDAQPESGTDGAHLWIEVIVETATGTSVEDVGEIPRALALSSNYPNPFRSATTLRFELPARTEVDLQVVDLLGRTVARLVEGSMEAGVHTVRFEARNLPSGVYLARLRAGSATHTRTLVLLR